MFENETQTQAAAEIAEVQISENELEQVAGGSLQQIAEAVARAIIDAATPDVY